MSPTLTASSSKSTGEMVSRGQPASASTWPALWKPGAHHHGVITTLADMLADAAHELHAGVGGEVLPGRLLVPVGDPADEGRDQIDAGIEAGLGLGVTEQQSQITVDAFPLQHLGGADPLPGRCQLDQYPVLGHAAFVVERDQLVSLVDAGLGVKGATSVETRPSTSLAISLPMATARRSTARLTRSSMPSPSPCDSYKTLSISS